MENNIMAAERIVSAWVSSLHGQPPTTGDQALLIHQIATLVETALQAQRTEARKTVLTLHGHKGTASLLRLSLRELWHDIVAAQEVLTRALTAVDVRDFHTAANFIHLAKKRLPPVDGPATSPAMKEWIENLSKKGPEA